MAEDDEGRRWGVQRRGRSAVAWAQPAVLTLALWLPLTLLVPRRPRCVETLYVLALAAVPTWIAANVALVQAEQLDWPMLLIPDEIAAPVSAGILVVMLTALARGRAVGRDGEADGEPEPRRQPDRGQRDVSTVTRRAATCVAALALVGLAATFDVWLRRFLPQRAADLAWWRAEERVRAGQVQMEEPEGIVTVSTMRESHAVLGPWGQPFIRRGVWFSRDMAGSDVHVQGQGKRWTVVEGATHPRATSLIPVLLLVGGLWLPLALLVPRLPGARWTEPLYVLALAAVPTWIAARSALVLAVLVDWPILLVPDAIAAPVSAGALIVLVTALARGGATGEGAESS